MTFLTCSSILLTKPFKIHDVFDFSILSIQWGGLATTIWMESMEKSKMSWLLNGFVNKLCEKVMNVMDIKWFKIHEKVKNVMDFKWCWCFKHSKEKACVRPIRWKVWKSKKCHGFEMVSLTKSMKMSRMSWILNGFVHKITEKVKNVMDLKWFR